MPVKILTGDALERLREMPAGSVDMILTDPPYGETSLKWDRLVQGWQAEALRLLKSHGSMWVFGSLKSHMKSSPYFEGWRIAQDIVWEKHNGSGAAADRFRRVHEIAVQYYPAARPWADIYKAPVFTNDAVALKLRRNTKPTQWGDMGKSFYEVEDGGPRLARSVFCVQSCHGYAEHPTQKPVALLQPLIQYSCPEGGLVLDPFAGSGSTGIAADSIGRNAILIEINPEYAAMARRRLDADRGGLLDLMEGAAC
jgi:site-specific DNA-methyltransferase (adenine-specific)